MSKEEEELVRELLWTLVNNHVFFQHPDLIRILCIHENVIAIMMNSISRASQDQAEGGEPKGNESDWTEAVREECRPLGPRQLFSANHASPGRYFARNGGGLLPIPVLLLQDLQAEPEGHVRPPHLHFRACRHLTIKVGELLLLFILLFSFGQVFSSPPGLPYEVLLPSMWPTPLSWTTPSWPWH